MVLKYISILLIPAFFIFGVAVANENVGPEVKTGNDANAQEYELSENCLITYREVREELNDLRACQKTSDCTVAFFTFPFGPETCKFYGVNTPNGMEKKKKVEQSIAKFTEECSKDKPDYQRWLNITGGKFRTTAEDCTEGKMFAECIEGRCITKFGYDINNKTPKITNLPSTDEI